MDGHNLNDVGKGPGEGSIIRRMWRNYYGDIAMYIPNPGIPANQEGFNIRQAIGFVRNHICSHTKIHPRPGTSIVEMCDNIYLDFFGYSWGAVEIAEVARILNNLGVTCRWDASLTMMRENTYFEAQVTADAFPVRFLGLISPVGEGLNAWWGDIREQGRNDPIPGFDNIPDPLETLVLGPGAAIVLDEFTMSNPLKCVPSNVVNFFIGYRNLFLPEWDLWRSIAFVEKHYVPSPATVDLCNHSRDCGIYPLMYPVNHTEAGNEVGQDGATPAGYPHPTEPTYFTAGALELARDLWRAYGLSLIGHKEEAEWRMEPWMQDSPRAPLREKLAIAEGFCEKARSTWSAASAEYLEKMRGQDWNEQVGAFVDPCTNKRSVPGKDFKQFQEPR